MVRQDLAQIVVDSLDQILVRNEARTQRKLGSEVAGMPVVVSAVFRGVPLCEVVTSQPDGPGDIQCELSSVDGNPLSQPRAKKHLHEIFQAEK